MAGPTQSNVRRVLFSNISMDQRSGTEMFLWDLTRLLKRRGIECGLYTPIAGELARKLRAEGVPVWSSARDIAMEPDLLHCQHLHTAVVLTERFPRTPAVYMVHDARSPYDTTVLHPRIRKIVAVDDYCRERVCSETSLPEEDVRVIFNGVDLEKFRPRPPLPAKPRSALIFTSFAEHSRHVELAARVSADRGIPLTRIGGAAGQVVENPERHLAGHDLVFAKARCALEAIAMGCAVVLIGPEGVGEMVTPETFEFMRRRNFGRSLLTSPLSAEALHAQIDRYSPDATVRVRDAVRQQCGIDSMTSEFISLYEEVLSGGPCMNPDVEWKIPSGPLATILSEMPEMAAGHRVRSDQTSQRSLSQRIQSSIKRLVK
jgi:hypothetical protein